MRVVGALGVVAAIGACGRVGFDGADTMRDSAGDGDGAAAPVFAFRKAISIPVSQNQSSTDLASFTAAVRISDADLRLASAGGHLETGVDLGFLGDDGAPLAFEIERLAATGDLFAWVTLPVLSASANTTFYLAFGNAAAVTGFDDPVATWREYAAVWHFDEGAYAGVAGEVIDATGVHHGTAVGGATTRVDGKLGAAASLPGECSHIAIDASGALQPPAVTVSAWVQATDLGVQERIATIAAQDSWRATGTGSQGYYVEVYRTVSQPEPTFYAANGPTYAHAFATGTTLVNDTWYHVAGTYDASTGVSSIYLDGALAGTATMAGAIDYLLKPLQIGCSSSGWWRGSIDEVRVAPFAMSAERLATEYANQVDPAAFMTVGPTEPAP